MDLINDKLSKIYLKYLAAASGSAFMGSVFGLVDMVMVGQYHGPEGSAAMGVIAPVWNIVYRFGLLAGIGGSVLFGALIMLLPLLLGSNSVWWAMPMAEAVIAVYVTASIVRVQKAFQKP